MRGPPITLTCDCEATGEVAYGERWTCESCGTTWDTAQIPAADYDVLIRNLKRYRLLAIGPPLLLAAILVPLSIFVGVQYAFILFVLVMAYGLLGIPQLRRHAARQMRESTMRWKLSPEQ